MALRNHIAARSRSARSDRKRTGADAAALAASWSTSQLEFPPPATFGRRSSTGEDAHYNLGRVDPAKYTDEYLTTYELIKRHKASVRAPHAEEPREGKSRSHGTPAAELQQSQGHPPVQSFESTTRTKARPDKGKPKTPRR